MKQKNTIITEEHAKKDVSFQENLQENFLLIFQLYFFATNKRGRVK